MTSSNLIISLDNSYGNYITVNYKGLSVYLAITMPT